jgi:hypothetical protein
MTIKGRIAAIENLDQPMPIFTVESQWCTIMRFASCGDEAKAFIEAFQTAKDIEIIIKVKDE